MVRKTFAASSLAVGLEHVGDLDDGQQVAVGALEREPVGRSARSGTDSVTGSAQGRPLSRCMSSTTRS